MGHFDYLLEDESRNFFQKVAEEQAVSQLKTQAPKKAALKMVKKAAVEPVSGFEKIAARLDADIELIKLAGPRGENIGMTERAMNYMARLERDENLEPEEYFEIFSKVAGAALDGDLEAVRNDIYLVAPPEMHDVLDASLGKVAADFLVDFASECEKRGMEKEAVGALLRKIVGRKAGQTIAKKIHPITGARIQVIAPRSTGAYRAAERIREVSGRAGAWGQKAYRKAFGTHAQRQAGRRAGMQHAREVVRAGLAAPSAARAAWHASAKKELAAKLTLERQNVGRLGAELRKAKAAGGDVARQAAIARSLEQANKRIGKLKKGIAKRSRKVQKETTLGHKAPRKETTSGTTARRRAERSRREEGGRRAGEAQRQAEESSRQRGREVGGGEAAGTTAGAVADRANRAGGGARRVRRGVGEEVGPGVYRRRPGFAESGRSGAVNLGTSGDRGTWQRGAGRGAGAGASEPRTRRRRTRREEAEDWQSAAESARRAGERRGWVPPGGGTTPRQPRTEPRTETPPRRTREEPPRRTRGEAEPGEGAEPLRRNRRFGEGGGAGAEAASARTRREQGRGRAGGEVRSERLGPNAPRQARQPNRRGRGVRGQGDRQRREIRQEARQPRRQEPTRERRAPREEGGQGEKSWWSKLSPEEQRNIALAGGAGVLAGSVLD